MVIKMNYFISREGLLIQIIRCSAEHLNSKPLGQEQCPDQNKHLCKHAIQICFIAAAEFKSQQLNSRPLSHAKEFPARTTNRTIHEYSFANMRSGTHRIRQTTVTIGDDELGIFIFRLFAVFASGWVAMCTQMPRVACVLPQM